MKKLTPYSGSSREVEPISLVEQMLEAIKSASPVTRATEDKIIAEIKALGADLLEQEEQTCRKQCSQKYPANYSSHARQREDVNLSSTRITHGETVQKDKWRLKEKGWVVPSPNVTLPATPKTPQTMSNPRIKSMQLEYKRHRQHNSAVLIQNSQIVQSKQGVDFFRNSNKLHTKSSLNYEKLIKQQIDLKVRTQYTTRQQECPQTQQINVLENDTYKKRQLKTIGTKQQVQQSLNHLLSRGQQMLSKRNIKIHNYKVKKLEQESKAATFKPSLVAKYYSSKAHIEPVPKISNFMKRLSKDMIHRDSVEKYLLKHELSLTSFQPRLNPMDDQQSKIKSIWQSNPPSLDQSRDQKLIEKSNYQSKSQISTVGVSLINPSELSFLLQ